LPDASQDCRVTVIVESSDQPFPAEVALRSFGAAKKLAVVASPRHEEAIVARAVGSSFVPFIMAADPYNRAFLDLSADGLIYVGDDEDNYVRHLDDAQLRQLRGVQRASAPGLLRVKTSRSRIDAGCVPRAASIISGTTRLSHLELFPDYVEPAKWAPHRMAVDVLLDAAASNPAAEIDGLSLRYWGENPDSWLRFADRFAPRIRALEVGAHAAMTELDVGRVVHGLCQLRSLICLTAFVEAEQFNDDPVPANVLVSVLPHLTPTALNLIIGGDLERPDNALQVTEELGRMSEAAVRSNKVTELSVRVDPDKPGTVPGYNGCTVLEPWMGSKSLKEVDLCRLSLIGPGAQPVVKTNNSTVTKICLVDTQLGERGLLLLSRLVALETIEFTRVTFDPPAVTTVLFGSLVNLERFMFFGAARNEDMEWLASNLSVASRALRSTTVLLHALRDRPRPVLPALRDVLANCPEELCLELGRGRDSSVPFLCEGISSAHSLTELLIHLYSPAYSEENLSLIFRSVRRNSSLRRFTFNDDFQGDRPLPIEDLLSRNASLEHFGYTSRSRGSFLSAVRGLRSNPPRLESISFDRAGQGPVIGEQSPFEIVLNMLRERNTSLTSIGDLVTESKEQFKQIQSLLKLNKYGKDFAFNPHAVPMQQWGDVLSRIRNEDCHKFVVDLARQALPADDQVAKFEEEAGDANEPAREALPLDDQVAEVEEDRPAAKRARLGSP
jgi:hypothetical protein